MWRKIATHNPDSDIVMLGKYYEESGQELATSYSYIADQKGYCYYAMPKSVYNELEQTLGDGAWVINQDFLDEQIRLNKTFYFNINPSHADKTFLRECEYLIRNDYCMSTSPNAAGYYYAYKKVQ